MKKVSIAILFIVLFVTNIFSYNLDWDFLNAAKKNDTAKVKSLLKKGANVNAQYPDIDKKTALIFASENGNLEMVKLLLQNRAKINTTCTQGYTALSYASENGHLRVVKTLFSAGAVINNKSYGSHKSDLMLASWSRHPEVVKVLISAGADVHARDGDGRNALMFASWAGGDTETVKILLKAGANVRVKDNFGRTPLIFSVFRRMRSDLRDWENTELVKLLVASGVDINAVFRLERKTALMYALDKNYKETVKILLSAGADVRAGDTAATLRMASEQGSVEMIKKLVAFRVNLEMRSHTITPIIAASREGHAEVINILISAGANVNALGNSEYSDFSPLMIACWRGHNDAVKALLKAPRINVNTKNRKGQTALMRAKTGELAQMLVKSGANIHLADNTGKTALMYHAEQGNSEIVRLLIKAGADVNVKNKGNWTALSFAQSKRKMEMVQLLKNAGARDTGAPSDALQDLLQGARQGDLILVKKALNNGANPHAALDREKNSALMVAAASGHIHLVRFFLSRITGGGSNAFGYTPLMKAAENGHTEVVRLLLASGKVYPNAVTRLDDRTALSFAAEKGHVEIVRLLIPKTGIINGGASFGYTALMWASRNGHIEVVRLLIAARAWVGLQTFRHGITALMLAAENGRTAVVRLLLTARADVNTKRKDGKTALQLALQKGHTEIIKLLKQAGARG